MTKIKESHYSNSEMGQNQVITEFIDKLSGLSREDAIQVIFNTVRSLGDTTRTVGFLATVNGCIEND